MVRVLVTGEPGIGKSRLLGELRRRLTDEGAIAGTSAAATPTAGPRLGARRAGPRPRRSRRRGFGRRGQREARRRRPLRRPRSQLAAGRARAAAGSRAATRMSTRSCGALGALPRPPGGGDPCRGGARRPALVRRRAACLRRRRGAGGGDPAAARRRNGTPRGPGSHRRLGGRRTACPHRAGRQRVRGACRGAGGDARGRSPEIDRRACRGQPAVRRELARLVAHGGSEDAAAPLPETVQSVIAARLDRMDPGSEPWLATRPSWASGSGGGPSSTSQAWIPIAPPRSMVRSSASRPWTSSGVRRDSSLVGDVELAFRHALVRDVAYGQLTRSDLARRHAATMRWLAGAADAERGDQAAAVADHGLTAIALGAGADAGPRWRRAPCDHGGLSRSSGRSRPVAGSRHAAAARIRVAIELAQDAPTRLRALAGWRTRAYDLGEFDAALRPADGGIARRRARRQRAARPAAPAPPPGAAGAWARPSRGEARASWTTFAPGHPRSPSWIAYSLQAGFALAAGRGAEQIAWADQAIGLADAQGWPVPPLALARRGYARAIMGDEVGQRPRTRAQHQPQRAAADGALGVHMPRRWAAIAYGDLGRAASALRQSLELVRERGLRGRLAHRLQPGLPGPRHGRLGRVRGLVRGGHRDGRANGRPALARQHACRAVDLRVEQRDEAGADGIAASIATLQAVNAPIDEDLVAIITGHPGRQAARWPWRRGRDRRDRGAGGR